jgi:predicted secreted protein
VRIVYLLFWGISLLWQFSFAGDEAQFVNLGWSQNFSHFAFGQFGIEDGSGFPYAELYVVDVEHNSYVKNGVFKNRIDSDDQNLTGLNVLLNLRTQIDSLFKSLKIDELNTGQIVYNSFMGKDVRWQNKDSKFELKCAQKTAGKFEDYTSKAAFRLELYQNGEQKETIGNIKRYRKGVLKYDIDRVLSDPEGKMFVVVVKKQMLGFEGPSIRYMVETTKLD